MFSRFGRYRKARTYSRKRIGRQAGVSFLSMRSKMRAAMDPPSAKRKLSAFMATNMSQGDEEKMGIDVQGGPHANTMSKLSMVRFKPINSTVFDYHHIARRVYMGNLNVVGTAGTQTKYDANFTKLGAITDIGDLAAIYGRFRITRARWEFIPHITKPQAGVSSANLQCLPDVSVQTFGTVYDVQNPNTTYAAAVDDANVFLARGDDKLTIDCIPIIIEYSTMSVNTGSNSLYQEAQSPWIDTAADPNFFCGNVIAYNTHGASTNYSQTYSIYLTTWSDFDRQK